MKYFVILLFCLLLTVACSSPIENKTQSAITLQRNGMQMAKFEPSNGKVILFVGQELEAVGGLEDYQDGYLDHYVKPAGWTSYTNLSPGDTSFGFIEKGLDGIWNTDNWGDGASNMNLQLSNPAFENMVLAIGVDMVDHEYEVAAGTHDSLILRLGEFLKVLAPRPIFLRIGYEFDGHSWNHYNREAYLEAYRRIKDMLDEMDVENVAYVWQSVGWVSDQYMLEEWYPGDAYVDWCGFSFFSRWNEQEMIEFARKKNKPVFIAEATPTISDHTMKFDGNTRMTVLSNQEQAMEAWERWFVPFFSTIDKNPDVVKAVSYINCYWLSHEMWKENPTFKRVDARLHTSEIIDRKWREEISKDKYIHSSATLYHDLKNHH